ncbi:GNAT family N-acetyltransferase [Aeromicrobium sp. Leaf350]|uniref:GNAT family N-acetyltransferase n=1 Tax=Aeromicrobium sp. Leaf350 TaxID=2876565 RepID=UPI001E5A37FD|nr:GNAT family N-acetyltransferase [Aeromicrobium sp. Leaf350]
MTGPAVSFRAAAPDDVPDVLRLMQQDGIGPTTPATTEPSARLLAAFDEISADPREDLLVGELGGVVVATAHVSWLRVLSADGGLYCQVENVRTDSAVRGRGLGTALMAHVEKLARSREAVRIQLTSNATRTDAHRFYERLGFTASHVGMKKYLT